MKNSLKEFNILIVGTGGQGLITLLKILSEAGKNEGFEVRTSELHGLSQRGGSVEVHIRFGKEIFSPLIGVGKADLIIALEMQEVLRSIKYIKKETQILLNQHIIPIPSQRSLSQKEILDILQKITKNVILVPASEICEKKLGTSITAGVYLLGYACFKNILPLRPSSVLKGIRKVIPKEHLKLNTQAFKFKFKK